MLRNCSLSGHIGLVGCSSVVVLLCWLFPVWHRLLSLRLFALLWMFPLGWSLIVWAGGLFCLFVVCLFWSFRVGCWVLCLIGRVCFCVFGFVCIRVRVLWSIFRLHLWSRIFVVSSRLSYPYITSSLGCGGSCSICAYMTLIASTVFLFSILAYSALSSLGTMIDRYSSSS